MIPDALKSVFQISFEDIDFKQPVGIYLEVFRNITLFSIVGVLFVVLYFIDYDMVFRPMTEKLKITEESIVQKKTTLSEKQAEQSRFQDLEKTLKGLDISITQVHPGESSKVVAVAQYKMMIDMAKGVLKPSTLPAPHNTRDFTSIDPKGESTINIAKDDPQGQAVNLARNTYELHVSGTYPALAELVNQIISAKQLFIIDKIELTPKPNQPPVDPVSTPQAPVILDMVLTFSIYLNDPNQSVTPVASNSGNGINLFHLSQ